MKTFQQYLDSTGEVGYVTGLVHSLLTVEGLPEVRPGELVVFELGGLGQVTAFGEEGVEVLPFSHEGVEVGERVARTGDLLGVKVGEALLGQTVDPLIRLKKGRAIGGKLEERLVDVEPLGLEVRRKVELPLETGVTLVDLVIPLGRGQRQLVIGDRQTGKTSFLLKALATQVRQGAVCVYALIGRKLSDVKRVEEFLEKNQLVDQTVVLASDASQPAGLVVLTPYTAVTVAEYFRDQGRDVLLILDDLTTHAKFYRQISLLGRRFPGRNSYPGDIFYVQAKIMERAGNFDKASISCLAVAESVMSDLSGYIETNLMAMTDGHLFFDAELAALGRYPAINPYLSVTRVGGQAQTPLVREINAELGRFLNQYRRSEELTHFGAELSEKVKRRLNLGEKLYALFSISSRKIVPANLSVYLVGSIWANFWEEVETEEMIKSMRQVIDRYRGEENFKKQVDQLVLASKTLRGLIMEVKNKRSMLIGGA